MAFILSPPIFLSILGVLCIGAAILAVSTYVSEEARKKGHDIEIDKYKQSVAELETLLTRSEAASVEAKKGYEAAALELSRTVKSQETLFAESQQLKAQIVSVRLEAANSSALLQEEIRQKQDLAERRVSLELEIVRLKNELELAVKMHEGLKGQYNELEEQFSQQINPPSEPKKDASLPSDKT